MLELSSPLAGNFVTRRDDDAGFETEAVLRLLR
jgi:hypothetical protein